MFGRRRSTSASASAIVDDIRRTIAVLDEQRRLAADAAGRALANQAEVKRACDEQLQTLGHAVGVAENAQTLALRAAATARRNADAGADPDVVAFEQTAAGLHTVQDALGAAAAPIHALLAAADGNVEQARRVLIRARGVLDDQIREQLRLLRALEQAERSRIVAEARRRP